MKKLFFSDKFYGLEQSLDGKCLGYPLRKIKEPHEIYELLLSLSIDFEMKLYVIYYDIITHEAQTNIQSKKIEIMSKKWWTKWGNILKRNVENHKLKKLKGAWDVIWM